MQTVQFPFIDRLRKYQLVLNDIFFLNANSLKQLHAPCCETINFFYKNIVPMYGNKI